MGATKSIRECLLLSSSVQCLLVYCAAEIHRTSKPWPKMLIDCSYLVRRWLPPFTLGLITTNLERGCHPPPVVNYELLPFWAAFLLLHHAGPDNVTSSENEEWLQELVWVVTQVSATILIYLRSPPNNRLHSASLMVLVAGTIKLGERVQSLYLASSKCWISSATIQPTPHAGPDYDKLSRAQLAIGEANLPILAADSEELPPKKFKPYSPMPQHVELDFNTGNQQLDEKSLLQFAISFYVNFKRFFTGGLTYDHEQRKFTRDFFLRRSSRDAFKLAEIELSFVHQDLHAKKAAVKQISFLRIITLGLVAAPLLSFYRYDKLGWSKIDICISYALLFEALVLEFHSILMLLLSRRNVIMLKYYDLIKPIADRIVKRRQWSKSFSTFNMIDFNVFCRTPSRMNFIEDNGSIGIGPIRAGQRAMRRIYKASASNTVSGSLQDKIFTELCKRSKLAQNVGTATKICSQRGEWVLMQTSCYSQLKWSLGDIEYGRSLLLWHIATDLICYNTNDCDNAFLYGERQFVEEISGYLLYLLLMKPELIAPVAGNKKITLWDTSLEAKRLFCKGSITNHKEACESILSMDADIKPVLLKGKRSASVLFDACKLAKQLSGFTKDKRWSLMSGVWIELLTYAAFHCEGTVHAKSPSKGGELLTFVWLLMNHLGLGKPFCKEEHPRTGSRVVVET